MAASFITSVYGHAEAEYIIKKSRFIASLKEVRREDEAQSFIEETRKHYWDASHNCYAYQLGSNTLTQKSNDDGEPSGTAGRPMLEVLKKSGITNTVVVVTRYFGGIKLGASGLIRAYSHAVSLGLAAAPIADYKPYDVYSIGFGYPFVSSIERLAPEFAIRIADRSFSDTVTFILEIPQEQTAAFCTALTNATNGKAIITEKDHITIPIIRTNDPQ
ncbi:MAG: YigZ family protein [Megasphaera sp.]|jgi:uncharacterized YigZ family protein|nr:YigZ family protein [Megasphaera sp.]